MKIDFWLELPIAIVCLLGDEVKESEKEESKNLISNKNIMNDIIKNIENSIDNYIENLKVKKDISTNNNNEQHIESIVQTYKEIEKLKERFKKIQKERSLIVIKSIKFSIGLIKRLALWTENKINLKQDILNHNVYEKVKMMLALVRNIN